MLNLCLMIVPGPVESTQRTNIRCDVGSSAYLGDELDKYLVVTRLYKEVMDVFHDDMELYHLWSVHDQLIDITLIAYLHPASSSRSSSAAMQYE
jgi:hypothetical protein